MLRRDANDWNLFSLGWAADFHEWDDARECCTVLILDSGPLNAYVMGQVDFANWRHTNHRLIG